MKKLIIGVFVVACLSMTSWAQGLKTTGSGAVDIVPDNWESIFETGDMNKDGIADLVVIATPCHKDKMTVRNDGYVYNFNQPVLAIYWGNKNGGFKLFKQYDNVIPARPSEFVDITPSLTINSKGVLEITLETFASAGSWEQPTTTYKYRYQNGDFFLIGKDEEVIKRNTGMITETSENYLTHKRIVTTKSASSEKSKSRRSVLPKTALQRLGKPLDE